jgi:hypothetical protein
MFTFLGEYPEEKKSFGRHRCEDNIKVKYKEIGGTGIARSV